MDSGTLVNLDIQKGSHVLHALDLAGYRCRTAFWLYENGEWMLVLAMPLVEQEGSRAAYAAVQKAISFLPPTQVVPLRQIKVVSPSDPLIKKVRTVLRIQGSNVGIRVTNSSFNNELIEDAYIYRST